MASSFPEADPSIVGYEVIEFLGKGDPMFGGSADDRPLGKSGEFLRGSYPISSVAQFATRALAEAASERAVKRAGSKVGIIPLRDFSRTAAAPQPPDTGDIREPLEPSGWNQMQPRGLVWAKLRLDGTRFSVRSNPHVGTWSWSAQAADGNILGKGETRSRASAQQQSEASAAPERPPPFGYTPPDPAWGLPPGQSRCSVCGKVGPTAKLKKHEHGCKSGKCGQGSLFGEPTPAERDIAARMEAERKRGK